MIPTGYGGRDSPDYGIGDVGQGLSVAIDGSELAARLGAIQTFSRTGQLLYASSFDYGLGSWDVVVDDPTSNAKLYTTSAFRSPYCVRLYCDSLADTWASISKSFGYPYLSTIGVEITFRIGKNLRWLEILGVAANKTNSQTFGICVNCKFDALQYWGNWGGWGSPETSTISPTDYERFHTMKVVVNLVDSTYKYVVVDDYRYTPPYTGLELGGAVTHSYIDFTIKLYQDESVESYVYIDDFIFTINEPT